ncbi:hypothetical protein VNO77_27236 [Canavalia gladiata]|uniref:Uncharacterized protein n=1 Tax=Canavalia gladiata TaxID=3824 RepID=A0AAN9KTN2_CANGL
MHAHHACDIQDTPLSDVEMGFYASRGASCYRGVHEVCPSTASPPYEAEILCGLGASEKESFYIHNSRWVGSSALAVRVYGVSSLTFTSRLLFMLLEQHPQRVIAWVWLTKVSRDVTSFTISPLSFATGLPTNKHASGLRLGIIGLPRPPFLSYHHSKTSLE